MYKIGIITASDKGFRGEREDTSSEVIREMTARLGTVVHYAILPDDEEALAGALKELADVHGLDLVLTTGGTGLGPRDITPEATKRVMEREVPGLAEALRIKGMAKTPHAMLSRGVAVVRGQTLIINLPGSPRGVRESLEIILPALAHGLEILKGQAGECGKD